MTLSSAVAALVKGIAVNDTVVIAERSPGRFPEEERLTVTLTKGDGTARLLTVVVYHGWKWYAPWAELTGIAPRVKIGGAHIHYYDSPLEDVMLTLFADAIQPPGHLFVSYETDYETARALITGVPAPATRLGFKLFQRGYTWFKDWYHPEGWMEGGQKLQAEKPLDEQRRRRHHANIQHELKAFLALDADAMDAVVAARGRARVILGECDM